MRFSVASALFALFAATTALASDSYNSGGGYNNGGGYNGGGGYAQPSSTPSSGKGNHWGCPDSDNSGHSKDSSKCDSYPYSGSVFGCTYTGGSGSSGSGGYTSGYTGGSSGSGSGSYTCTYDSNTGECTGGSSTCPSSADSYTSNGKRVAAPEPAPVPVPGQPPYARHQRLH